MTARRRQAVAWLSRLQLCTVAAVAVTHGLWTWMGAGPATHARVVLAGGRCCDVASEPLHAHAHAASRLARWHSSVHLTSRMHRLQLQP